MQELHLVPFCAPCIAPGPMGMPESARLHRRLGPHLLQHKEPPPEFASENSWFLLTGEGRAVPGFRISVHTAQKFSCTSNFSLPVCHSFLFSSPCSLPGSCK